MTQNEIIEMAQDCGFTRTHTGDVKLWLCNKNNLEAFAKLVAAKAIAELESQDHIEQHLEMVQLSAAQRNELLQIKDGTWEADRNG